jgi:CIC family chloride channel protein
MIFEITQDYQIILPLMVANMLSLAISRRFQPVPVYTALLRQDGVQLPERSTTRASGGAVAASS